MYWYGDFFPFPMTQNKSRAKLAEYENNQVFINTFMELAEAGLKRYKIENLPDTVSERVVLLALMAYGAVVFFERNGSILALPGAPGGKGFTIYGEPVEAWVFSRNGLENRKIPLHIPGENEDDFVTLGTLGQKAEDPRGVMVWENRQRYPFITYVIYYAAAISDTLRTIDVARKWYKMPAIPVCEESLVESTLETFKKICRNDEIIPISAGNLASGLGTSDRMKLEPAGDVTRNIESAMALVDWYRMQYRLLCNYDSNTAIDKKGENLITDEININDSYTDIQWSEQRDYLDSQLDFANKVFGLNMQVAERAYNDPEEERGHEEADDGGADDISGLDRGGE